MADSGGGFWVPGSDATPFNIVFDFQLPRVVDEITIVFSINGYELGTWQVDGSNDRVCSPNPWVSASALVKFTRQHHSLDFIDLEGSKELRLKHLTGHPLDLE